MKSNNLFSIALLCVSFFIGCSQSSLENRDMSDKSDHDSPDDVTQKSIDLWKKHFRKAKIGVGDRFDRIDMAMHGKYRDMAEFIPGGSGARRVHYLIDDFVEIIFFFDPTGALELEPQVRPRTRWRRSPDGTLFWTYP